MALKNGYFVLKAEAGDDLLDCLLRRYVRVVDLDVMLRVEEIILTVHPITLIGIQGILL